MALIGKLDIDLVARTEKLISGCGKGETVLKGFAGNAQAILTNLAAGVSIGAGLAKFVDLIGQIDETADLANSLGTTVNELNALEQAGNMAGSSLESITGAIGKLPRILATAAADGGKAADAIEKLGLDVSDLIGMDATSAFEAIGDQISGIEDPVQRAQMAYAIFGKSAQGVINILSNSGEIEKARQHMEALALTLGEDQVAAAQEAADAYDTLNKAGSMVGQGLAADFAPALTVMSEFALMVIQGVRGLLDIGKAMTVMTVGIGGSGIASLFGIDPEAWQDSFSAAFDDVVDDADKKLTSAGNVAPWAEGLPAQPEKSPTDLAAGEAAMAEADAIEKAEEAAAKLEETLKRQADELTFSKSELALMTLDMERIGEAEYDRLAAMQAEVVAAQELKALEENYESINKQLDQRLAVLEGISQQEQEITKLAEAGLAGTGELQRKHDLIEAIEKQHDLEKDLANEEKRRQEDIDKAMAKDAVLPEVIDQGSVADYKATISQELGRDAEQYQKDSLAELRRQVELQKALVELLRNNAPQSQIELAQAEIP
jgi:hypothetical protein